VPRQSRSARSRARSRRTTAPAASTTTANPPPVEPAPAASAAAPRTMPRARTTVVRPQAAPGSLSRGFVTDYGFVIGELKRIVLLTAGIIVLLLVLWLILG
jgi:hypothetical protein